MPITVRTLSAGEPLHRSPSAGPGCPTTVAERTNRVASDSATDAQPARYPAQTVPEPSDPVRFLAIFPIFQAPEPADRIQVLFDPPVYLGVCVVDRRR